MSKKNRGYWTWIKGLYNCALWSNHSLIILRRLRLSSNWGESIEVRGPSAWTGGKSFQPAPDLLRRRTKGRTLSLFFDSSGRGHRSPSSRVLSWSSSSMRAGFVPEPKCPLAGPGYCQSHGKKVLVDRLVAWGVAENKRMATMMSDKGLEWQWCPVWKAFTRMHDAISIRIGSRMREIFKRH